MNDYEAALRKYINSTLNHAQQCGYGIETARSWLFGAIDFYFCIDLIDTDTYNKLLNEFVFVEQIKTEEE